MKNKILFIITILIITLSVTACTTIEKTDALKFKEEYESLNGTTRKKDGKQIRNITIAEDNPMIYATTGDIIEKMENKDTFLVYFGFNDCPWCRSVLPTLIQVANDLGLDKIYYVDVKEIRDIIEVDESGNLVITTKGSDDYYVLIELLKDVLADYTVKDSFGNTVSTGEKRIFAPNVVAVTNGQAKSMETGISELQTSGYMKLTDEMISETYNKFKCLIDCIMEVSNTCSIDTVC